MSEHCELCNQYYSVSKYFDHLPHCESKKAMTSESAKQDRCREEFEKWCQSKFGWIPAISDDPESMRGAYSAAWQSRAQEIEELVEALQFIANFSVDSDIMNVAKEVLSRHSTASGE